MSKSNIHTRTRDSTARRRFYDTQRSQKRGSEQRGTRPSENVDTYPHDTRKEEVPRSFKLYEKTVLGSYNIFDTDRAHENDGVYQTGLSVEERAINRLTDMINRVKPKEARDESISVNPASSEIVKFRGKEREKRIDKKKSKTKKLLEEHKSKNVGDNESIDRENGTNKVYGNAVVSPDEIAVGSGQRKTFIGLNCGGQIVTTDLNTAVKNLMSLLYTFQEKKSNMKISKAKNKGQLKLKKKTKLRYVVGLHETLKYARQEEAELVVLAPNIEACPGDKGLDWYASTITEICTEKGIPLVYAGSKNKLGNFIRIRRPVSCICVLFVDGAEKELKEVLKTAKSARESADVVDSEMIGGDFGNIANDNQETPLFSVESTETEVKASKLSISSANEQ